MCFQIDNILLCEKIGGSIQNYQYKIQSFRINDELNNEFQIIIFNTFIRVIKRLKYLK